MATEQLFIPNKIKVGFQNRGGTYSGKLAYVIYYDNKGVLRKEKSWESWRDKKIEAAEFNNEPTEGFVLNKGVGGVRQSSGWNARNEYIRIYDPRDFEFEISVANLLFILKEGDCTRGKGLEGKFVYAWDGTELVLLPEHSEDYKNCVQYTNLQSCKVSAKSLIPGAFYETKQQNILTYLGRFENYGRQYYDTPGLMYVFWNEKPIREYVNRECKETHFVFMKTLKNVAKLHSETINPEYASFIEKYNNSRHSVKFLNLSLKASNMNVASRTYYEESKGKYILCKGYYETYGDHYVDYRPNGNNSVPAYYELVQSVYIQDGQLKIENLGGRNKEFEKAKKGSKIYNACVANPLSNLFAKLDNGETRKLVNYESHHFEF